MSRRICAVCKKEIAIGESMTIDGLSHYECVHQPKESKDQEIARQIADPNFLALRHAEEEIARLKREVEAATADAAEWKRLYHSQEKHYEWAEQRLEAAIEALTKERDELRERVKELEKP